MKPEEFVQKYYPLAKEIESETTIPALAIMAQAALESGWGNKGIGNNLFGIKYKKGDPGFQKVLTTEYSKRDDLFPEDEIVSKVFVKETGKFKYKIWQYFADYPTAKDGFMAHAKLLLTDRYVGCLRYKDDPEKYLECVWRSGYATDPNYAVKMRAMIKSIKKRI